MALTSTQKAQIRRYLGHPDVNRLQNHALEGAMDAISAEGEVEVEAILTSLASLDTKLSASWDRQKVSKAEEVTLAGPEEIRALRAEGRRLVESLAATLDVEVRRHPYGGTNSTGISGF